MRKHGNFAGKVAAASALALLLAGVSPARAPQKDDKESNSKGSQTTVIHIVVTGGDKDVPVSNASVYVRYSEKGGLFHKDKLSEMNLKTNQEGMAKSPPVPTGKVLIQIVVPEWKTFGKWYTLEKDEETIKIKLDKPKRWY